VLVNWDNYIFSKFDIVVVNFVGCLYISGLELKIASERILLIKDQFNAEEIEVKAQSKRIDAFGTLNKLSGLFSRPTENDFEVIYREHRYQPFWHVAAKANYVYDRNSHYQFEVKGSEVEATTIEGKDYEVTNGHAHIPVVEHCKQMLDEVTLADAVSGSEDAALKNYLSKELMVVVGDNLGDMAGKDAVIVPPQVRVSGIFREMLSQMIKAIQADQIFEEQIEITCIDLYYRPVYAFQFHWKSKNLKAILEIDAVMGTAGAGTRTFSEYLGKSLDRDFLFDIGADAAGIFIPGGSIAVKAAKKMIDSKRK